MSYDKESTCSLDFGSMQPESTPQQNTSSNTQLSIAAEFQQAVSLDLKNKYEESLIIYKKLLKANSDLSPDQISDISFNAALASFKIKDFSRSFIYNQKALSLNPYRNDAKILSEKINKEFQLPVQNHQFTLIEKLNSFGLNRLPIELLGLTSLIIFFLCLKKLTQFLLHKMNAYKNNLDFEKWPPILSVYIFVFSLVMGLATIKYLDHIQPKGYLSTDIVSIKSAPGENQATLTDYTVGTYVHILRQSVVNQQVYFQIKRPGGVAGWVKSNDIEAVVLPKDSPSTLITTN